MNASVSIDPDKKITITAASRGAGMQNTLSVALSVAERMTGARNQKMLYGIVTEIELQAIQAVVWWFAEATRERLNAEMREEYARNATVTTASSTSPSKRRSSSRKQSR